MVSSVQNFENNNLLQAHPKATYKKVIEDRSVFMETLEDLLEAVGTKFRVPEIAGKPLDLHCLFVQVSLRGGIRKVIADGRWGEVTSLFSFPPTTPSASFYIRSHYIIFLLTYEEFYLFRGKQPELPLYDAKNDSASLAFIPDVPKLHSRAVSYYIPDTTVDAVSQSFIPTIPNLHSKAVSYNIPDTKVDSISQASIPVVPYLYSRAVNYNISDTKVDSVSQASIPVVPNLNRRAVNYNILDVKVESVSEASIPAAPNLQDVKIGRVPEASIPAVPNLQDVKIESVSEASIPAVPNLQDVEVESVSEASIPAVPNLQGTKVNSVSEGSIPAVPYSHGRAVSNNTSGQHLLKVGDKVRGKMNGKFENGYTISATIGSEVMHGVLYFVPMEQQAQPLNSRGNSQKRCRDDTSNSGLKSNDKGYDLFLHQLYPRIAPFYPGQEEVTISYIKSLWDKLSEFEQKVYQDRANIKLTHMN